MTRLIRSDEFGTYVLTGGYAFRPPVGSVVRAGDRVKATHIGGTQTARVGSERWRSFAADPQYIKYVYEPMRKWKGDEYVDEMLEFIANNAKAQAEWAECLESVGFQKREAQS